MNPPRGSGAEATQCREPPRIERRDSFPALESEEGAGSGKTATPSWTSLGALDRSRRTVTRRRPHASSGRFTPTYARGRVEFPRALSNDVKSHGINL